MPERETVEHAREDAREGKAPSTQAGEFVREEMHHIREGKHGARSPQQAIAIGLSKARRAGVALRAPKRGTVSARAGRPPSASWRRVRAIGRGSRRDGARVPLAKRSVEKGIRGGSVQPSAVEARAGQCPTPYGECPIGSRQTRRAHQGAGWPFGGRAPRRPHSSQSPIALTSDAVPGAALERHERSVSYSMSYSEVLR